MSPVYGFTGKLFDCLEHGRNSSAELFIVEGDSAANAVAQVCDSQRQAVLPVQGKPLNAVRAKEQAVRGNPFLAPIIHAIDAGLGSSFDVNRSRYSRILLLCDPDADGIHCATLLLLFFHTWMPPLVETGCVSMIRPPCMKLSHPDFSSPLYPRSEEEADELMKAHANGNRKDFIKERFRGLASLSANLLWSTCVAPATRSEDIMRSNDAIASKRILLG